MSIKIENIDIYGWEAAIRGARNPMNSWKKSDSWFLESQEEGAYYYRDLIPHDDYYDHCSDDPNDKEIFRERMKYNKDETILIGPNDHKLLMNLCKGGSEESKWRRFVHVSMDIIAPLYWWKEADTYRVGTACNSCSTMHKIQAKEFTLEDFSCEHLTFFSKNSLNEIIKQLNWCREMFNTPDDKLDMDILKKLGYETKKDLWYQMIQLLPTSYNQRRTIDLNYEVLAAQYRQRKNHKLDEWREYCEFIKTLPYSELITMEDSD